MQTIIETIKGLLALGSYLRALGQVQVSFEGGLLIKHKTGSSIFFREDGTLVVYGAKNVHTDMKEAFLIKSPAYDHLTQAELIALQDQTKTWYYARVKDAEPIGRR